MIEINLLPDVKRELLRAQRARTGVIAGAILVSIIAVAIVSLLLLYIFIIQGLRNDLLSTNISQKSEELKQVEDVSELLTIQNQLVKITELNSKKYINSRVFDMVSAISPAEPNTVSFSQLSITNPADEEGASEEESEDVATAGQIRLEGQTSSYDSLEVFKKTIENTFIEYTTEDEATTVALASNISVSDVNYGEDIDGVMVVRFVLTFEYAPELLSPDVPNVTFKLNIDGNVTDSYLGIPRFTERATDVEEVAE